VKHKKRRVGKCACAAPSWFGDGANSGLAAGYRHLSTHSSTVHAVHPNPRPTTSIHPTPSFDLESGVYYLPTNYSQPGSPYGYYIWRSCACRLASIALPTAHRYPSIDLSQQYSCERAAERCELCQTPHQPRRRSQAAVSSSCCLVKLLLEK